MTTSSETTVGVGAATRAGGASWLMLIVLLAGQFMALVPADETRGDGPLLSLSVFRAPGRLAGLAAMTPC